MENYIPKEILNAVKPTRISINRVEEVKWDKMRWASLIFIVGFVVAASIYIGYWYATDYQEIKLQDVMKESKDISCVDCSYSLNGTDYKGVFLDNSLETCEIDYDNL